MQYFFILGKNPILSKAEIVAVLEFLNFKFKISIFSDNVLIINSEKNIDIEKFNERLGGTIKIGKILDKIEKLQEFEAKFFKLIKFGSGKVHFGFSLYLLDKDLHLKKYLKQVRPLAMDIKRKLREEKHLNSRWVSSKEPELSSVIVKKNQLLKYGSEICFFIKDNEILIGQTLAVQPFEEFGQRDFGRPGRDSFSGMLPPKLAKIMINLAKIKPDKKILDPFCGSGTILQEALVLGYHDLLGTDNSLKAIEDTKKNLNWLTQKFSISNFQLAIKNVDVNNLSGKIKLNSINAIVTEPYLGPPLKGNEAISKIETTAKELEDLYLEAFNQFYRVLQKKGKIVIIFPIFKLKHYQRKLNIIKQIEELGFKQLNKDILIYSRPNQFVWRQIFIFEK